MRKILGLSVAALLVMGLVGGGTWAFFSSEVGIADNTITAGSLNLNMGTPAAIDITLGGSTSEPIYPGSRGIAANWNLDNTGTITGDLSVTTTAITDNASNGVELADNLYVLFWLDTADDGNLDTEDLILTDGSTDNWSGAGNTALGDIDEGDMVLLSTVDDQTWSDIYAITSAGTPPSFNIYYYFYDDATNQNDCQGDALNFDVTFELTQQ